MAPMRALGPDKFGPILELISPLFLAKKGPKWSQILCRDPEHDPSVLRVAVWGHWGQLGAIQEEKRHPQTHSGAVLSVFWPLFWVSKDLYHILGQCVGPCWTSANYWEPFGAILDGLL